MKIIDVVKNDNMAYFSHYCGGNLYYTVNVDDDVLVQPDYLVNIEKDKLPFEDNSIETLSSLCVVEHIGLGRYGDPLDPFGSEKAIKELGRVLKTDGVILFSVPIDNENKIYFNAHRAFTRDYILELFSGFEILDEKYHYGTKMYDKYDSSKGFGTGLYMLKKLDN